MFVLSYVSSPVSGAGFGKATVSEEVADVQAAADLVGDLLIAAGVRTLAARQFGQAVAEVGINAEVTHPDTGVTVRIHPADAAPNACPCCGRLVLPSDHALAGSEDAYCLGCYTWDRNATSCLPENTAHHNPWSMAAGADVRWALEATIDRGDETDFDTRYSTDAELLHEDPIDAALIAWPGLTRDQIIEAAITALD